MRIAIIMSRHIIDDGDIVSIVNNSWIGNLMTVFMVSYKGINIGLIVA